MMSKFSLLRNSKKRPIINDPSLPECEPTDPMIIEQINNLALNNELILLKKLIISDGIDSALVEWSKNYPDCEFVKVPPSKKRIK